MKPTYLLLVAGLLTTIAPNGARADEKDEIQALRAEIHALEQRLDALEQRKPVAAPAVAPAKVGPAKSTADTLQSTARISAGENGLVVASTDGQDVVHVGAQLQLDSREFLGDGGGVLNNSFLLRRARPTIDGTIDKIYSFTFLPEFGGTSPVAIFDVYGGIALSDELQFRLGKFKSPIGLEQLQQDAWTSFSERSLVTNLVPNRDVGLQAGGALAGGWINYQVALLNGVPDAANTSNADFDNDKDLDARVFLTPGNGLGVGIAGNVGREKGASGVASGYKTDGQQTFFKYASTVVADGEDWRLSPQAYWYAGPFNALAEYVVSTVNVRPTATAAKTQLQNTAWQLTAGWVLTGEAATFDGVKPAEPFSWRDGRWGAWQIEARYADLKIDPNAFPLFASPSVNAREASAWGIGINWYLNPIVRINQDFFDTSFSNGVPVSGTQILRQDEKALITRFQIAF